MTVKRKAAAPKMPLEGIRVADFGWRIAAPLAARLLAWGGAEVIRVESAVRNDGARMFEPMTPGVPGSYNVSGSWNEINSSKLSVSINLGHPKGRELALRLVAISDILLENFSAGAMERMGLGYDVLTKYRPDLIMISHPLTGLTGRWKDVKGHGPMATAMAGLNSLSGYPDSPPIALGFAYADHLVNPHHSVFAVLSALHYRRRTGKGQHIDLSQYESVANTLGPSVLQYTVQGRDCQRPGNRSPLAAPQGVYPCLPLKHKGKEYEHYCAISVATDEEWRSLCRVTGRTELAADPRYAAFADRKAREDEIDELLSAWTRGLEAQDVMLRLQTAGVAAGVVQNAKDLLENDSHLAARRYFREIVHPEAGKTKYEMPFALSECPVEPRRAPLLGEHNEYVFRELLHMSEDEINQGYVENYIA